MSRATERACARNEDQIMDLENVVGIAPAEHEDTIVVLVERKLPLDQLNPDDVVPETVEGFRTRVLQIEKVEAKLQAGASIGLRNGGTGTAGGVVVDEHGQRYVITNNHVAANSNAARVLAELHSPGPRDGLGRVFGQLGRFEPIWFNGANYVDVALVKLLNHAPFTHPARTIQAQVGWNVRKRGRTSGLTHGRVLARNVTVDVSMGNGTARFRNQIMTDYMLAAGDSGSLLVTSGGFVCGLGFAGSNSVSFHNPIEQVLRTMGVAFR